MLENAIARLPNGFGSSRGVDCGSLRDRVLRSSQPIALDARLQGRGRRRPVMGTDALSSQTRKLFKPQRRPRSPKCPAKRHLEQTAWLRVGAATGEAPDDAPNGEKVRLRMSRFSISRLLAPAVSLRCHATARSSRRLDRRAVPGRSGLLVESHGGNADGWRRGGPCRGYGGAGGAAGLRSSRSGRA
jgi:hypothetical protein